MARPLTSEAIDVESFEKAIELFFEKGWTDGLPVIPPTENRVLQFLEYAGLEPDTVVGNIPERDRVITAEKVAINAVMAGCKAEYMPVLVAAVEAICDPAYKFNHMATLGSAWPLLIVNGPIAAELGIRSGMYLFGPDGSRASSTIARGLSLLLWNCAEAKPGGIQRGQWGNPGRWHFCIAENETTVWEPLHVQLGFDRQISTVTAISTRPAPCQVFAERPEPELALDSVCDALATNQFAPGTYPLFIPPPIVAMFAKHNWTKNDVRNYVVENTKRSVADLKRNGRWGRGANLAEGFSALKQEIQPGDDERYAYLFKPSEYDDFLLGGSYVDRKTTNDIYVVVAGGNAGPRVCFVPPYGVADPVTKAVRLPK